MGSDKEVESDFQLIAGTNRDLRSAVAAGRFRDDLLARINLWIFELPALRQRREDAEPNIDYELERFARENDANVRFNAEARREYQRFATSPVAVWNGNFRELSASIMRMATLAEGGKITVEVVKDEIDRLRHAWQPGTIAQRARIAVAAAKARRARPVRSAATGRGHRNLPFVRDTGRSRQKVICSIADSPPRGERQRSAEEISCPLRLGLGSTAAITAHRPSISLDTFPGAA